MLECVELEQVRRKYLPPSMLSQNRSSLACLDLMGYREYEQKTGLFLLKARQIRSAAVEVCDTNWGRDNEWLDIIIGEGSDTYKVGLLLGTKHVRVSSRPLRGNMLVVESSDINDPLPASDWWLCSTNDSPRADIDPNPPTYHLRRDLYSSFYSTDSWDEPWNGSKTTPFFSLPLLLLPTADRIEQLSSAESTLGLASLTRENTVHHGALVAASGYALYLFLLHDGAHGTAPLTLCTFQRVLTTIGLEFKIIS
ncbi:hypothetical protein ANN_23071 [Periplaneta americana]|uniref:Uncharacterized protein n=1 Tax=Periplaneta americana TaxID=6978 RepID=A0ABQ8SKX5_PERAM|nr:hypothetical protein ANN_23071 [Periplaneta americana]